MNLPPLSRIRWSRAYRTIPSRYPPVDLFERIAPPRDWEALCELEDLTNPRLRQEAGSISIVPPEERISGPGTSFVMAAFTHTGSGARFSDESFGAYYTANALLTSLREVAHHMEEFYGATQEAEQFSEAFRVLLNRIDGIFHDIRAPGKRWRPCYAPEDYTASRSLARELKSINSNGVAYNSLRHRGGQCLAIFRPKAVCGEDLSRLPVQERHVRLHWNGVKIDKYFDYREDAWNDLS